MRSFTSGAPAGRRDNAPVGSDTIMVRVLAANTAENFAIPTGAQFVNMAGTSDFFVKFMPDSTNTAVPSGDITDGTGPMLNPGLRQIPPGATNISVVASGTPTVTFEFWG